ncbi:MAG: HdeD family acid-resistance protein [Acidimicrobiales bacterium]
MQASQVGTTAGREGGMAIPNGAGLPDAERDVLRVVGRSWGWVLFFGIVTLVLGILVALRPESSIYFFAFVLGIWLFVSGLFRVVVAIADDDDTGGMRWLIAILGVLSVIIGILFLRHTDETLTSLAFLIGLFWVVGGMIEFFTAYGDRSMDARGFRVVMGLLAIAAGVLTLVWPGITLVVLAVVIGAWLAIYGLLEIAVSFQLRRLAKV